MSKLKITETALRDGHQSLMATRLKTDEIIPILETMDKVGYHSMEVWGGATFDSCIRFLNEDPWERLRLIRKHVKNTKLQMLLRGQNLLGYRHYGDDTVDRFIELSIKNGIDIPYKLTYETEESYTTTIEGTSDKINENAEKTDENADEIEKLKTNVKKNSTSISKLKQQVRKSLEKVGFLMTGSASTLKDDTGYYNSPMNFIIDLQEE